MFLELQQNNESGTFKLMYCLDEFTGNLGEGSILKHTSNTLRLHYKNEP
jgi:hypothetical protein